MTLPQTKRPSYEAPIPTVAEPMVFQPFTMADKRNLLSAISFKDPKSFVRTVVEIVQTCTNLESIRPNPPLHLIEMAFLEVYARSTGGVIEADYTCDATVHAKPDWPMRTLDSGETLRVDEASLTEEERAALEIPIDRMCGHTIAVRIPIEGTVIDFGDLTPGDDYTVRFPDGVFMVLGVPGWDVMKKYIGGDDEQPKTFDISDDFVFECVKAIGDASNTYTHEDFTKQEFVEWVDGLAADSQELMQPFFANIPVVTKSIDVTCPICSTKKRIVLRGLDDFFV